MKRRVRIVIFKVRKRSTVVLRPTISKSLCQKVLGQIVFTQGQRVLGMHVCVYTTKKEPVWEYHINTFYGEV